MIAVCKLCERRANLALSHFIPAGFYRLLRTADDTDPNPVVVQNGRAFTTSQQVTAHLLCTECEQRFSRGGENGVLNLCSRGSDEFRLRDMALGWSEVALVDDVSLRTIPAAHHDIAAQCSYFAASVFWRGSAQLWRAGRNVIETSRLGPYEDQFRQYLLGNSGFPDCARLVLHVTSNPQNVVMVPSATRHEGYIRHKFHVPGLLFIIFVGKKLPPWVPGVGIAPEHNSVFLGPVQRDDWFVNGARKAAQAQRVGKFGSAS